jgi:hypothetical protein
MWPVPIELEEGRMNPPIYTAVRALGVLRPKFQNKPVAGKVFADELNVRGTAFWLRDQRVLVTCAHVIKGLVEAPIEISGLLVVGNQGNYLRATIGIVDIEHDLAILHLEAPAEVLQQQASTGLTLADSYPEVGTKVAYAGFPLGNQLLDEKHLPTYAEGVVGAACVPNIGKKNIRITGTVVGGFSGSPIVDLARPEQVLGVLSNSPSKEAGEADIFVAVSWEYLRALASLAAA